MSAEPRAASGSSPTGAPVQIIATREQMSALKAQGWLTYRAAMRDALAYLRAVLADKEDANG